MSPLLEVRDVRKWYRSSGGLVPFRSVPAVHAVDGVTFDLAKGEILGLVGESGSGKSTTGELIVRLQDPTSGEIVFDGASVAGLRRRELRRFRRRINMIFQDPYATLDPRYTVLRTVAEPLVIDGLRDGVERRRRVERALHRAELRPASMFLDLYPNQLSGGQRQRVSIARAIVLEPELLVADEPVSMLDVSVRGGVLRLLRMLRDTLGLTILFISHDLSAVRYLCDRVAIMYLGRIVEIGPVDEVLGRAHHPYTRALLHAVPIADPTVRREGLHVSGEPSSNVDLPPGCRFAPRCPYRGPGCDSAEPELTPVGGSEVRCIYPRMGPVWPEG